MYHKMSLKQCSNYRALEQDLFSHHRQSNQAPNCRNCVYFSSRNCGMDAKDAMNPIVDFLC